MLSQKTYGLPAIFLTPKTCFFRTFMAHGRISFCLANFWQFTECFLKKRLEVGVILRCMLHPVFEHESRNAHLREPSRRIVAFFIHHQYVKRTAGSHNNCRTVSLSFSRFEYSN